MPTDEQRSSLNELCNGPSWIPGSHSSKQTA